MRMGVDNKLEHDFLLQEISTTCSIIIAAYYRLPQFRIKQFISKKKVAILFLKKYITLLIKLQVKEDSNPYLHNLNIHFRKLP